MIKNRKSYKTIGEVAKEISTNTHTLRFWETQNFYRFDKTK